MSVGPDRIRLRSVVRANELGSSSIHRFQFLFVRVTLYNSAIEVWHSVGNYPPGGNVVPPYGPVAIIRHRNGAAGVYSSEVARGGDLDDADEILRRFPGGGEAECSAMVRRFQPREYRLAPRVTGDPARANEAAAAVPVEIGYESPLAKSDSR